MAAVVENKGTHQKYLKKINLSVFLKNLLRVKCLVLKYKRTEKALAKMSKSKPVIIMQKTTSEKIHECLKLLSAIVLNASNKTYYH